MILAALIGLTIRHFTGYAMALPTALVVGIFVAPLIVPNRGACSWSPSESRSEQIR